MGRRSCDMDCLNCKFEKCLDEMTPRERKKAKDAVKDESGMTAAEKRKKQKAEWYQKNKERLAEERKQKKKEQEAMEKEPAEEVLTEAVEETKEESKKMLEKETAAEMQAEEAAQEMQAEEEQGKAVQAEIDGERMLLLSRSHAESLREFIEENLFQNIREDTEIDSMDWLADICDIWRALK